MKHFFRPLLIVVSLVLLLSQHSVAADPSWMVGMRLGMSLFTGLGGGGEVTVPRFNPQTGQFTNETIGGESGTKAGLQLGPTAEVIFDKKYAVVTTFNINTQGGTPIEWGNYFKYYFPISGSKIRPYADAGFSLYFQTGGPYFSIPFGGGALFPIGKNLYIPADLQFGPVFYTGKTAFVIQATSGIRFEFN